MVEQNLTNPFVNIDALIKEKKARIRDIGNLKNRKEKNEENFFLFYQGIIKHRSFVVIIL
jgi:hypothetical protein